MVIKNEKQKMFSEMKDTSLSYTCKKSIGQ